MTDALLSFMRTGSPNCASLPEWPQYTPDKGATDDVERPVRSSLRP
ncbi:MAG: hypothetical protein ACLUHA_13925 [Bacteroides stercoris]